MHKFLRSVGFGAYRKKRDIERLLDDLEKGNARQCLEIDEDENLCEIRAEVAPGMGIVMVGSAEQDCHKQDQPVADYKQVKQGDYDSPDCFV